MVERLPTVERERDGESATRERERHETERAESEADGEEGEIFLQFLSMFLMPKNRYNLPRISSSYLYFFHFFPPPGMNAVNVYL